MEFYQRLSKNTAQIRLLTVLPSKIDEAVQCTLHTVSLHENPTFEALSYTWGDPGVTQPITVEDTPFDATVNLEMALRALRDPKKPRVLWIDAICINQADTDEKSIQIPLMGDIYRNATDVVVWLGPATPEIELAVSWIRTYVLKSLDSSSKPWLKMDAAATLSRRARRERDMQRLKALQGYFELFSFPYWTRMWTFQEYRLPRNEPITACGNLTIRASEFGQGQDAIHDVGFGVITGVSQILNGRRSDDLSEDQMTFVEEVQKRAILLRQKSDISLETVHMSPMMFRGEWENKVSPLLYLLMTTAERACFDPRDKIYALYGMVPAMAQVYPADYHNPPELVFRQAATYIINHEAGAVMCKSFGLRDDRLSDDSYPSWVPDFRRAGTRNMPNLHPAINNVAPNPKNLSDRVSLQLAEPLRTLGDSAPAARVDEHLTVLHLFARSLGACRVAFHFGDTSSTVLRQIRGLVKTDPASVPETSAGRMIRNQETLLERMARVCVAHTSQNIQFTPAEIIKAFDRVLDDVDAGHNGKLKNDPAASVCLTAAEELVGKTLFVTEEGGFFGIGVGTIEDGDIVTLPPEVRMPLVFRALERASRDGIKGQYRLVGTVYLDGITEPASLDEATIAEVEQIGLEEFTIW